MSKTSIPKNYHDLLGLYDTQRAIGIIKTIFQEKLCAALHLKRVTAPLFVLNGSGLNDEMCIRDRGLLHHRKRGSCSSTYNANVF